VDPGGLIKVESCFQPDGMPGLRAFESGPATEPKSIGEPIHNAEATQSSGHAPFDSFLGSDWTQALLEVPVNRGMVLPGSSTLHPENRGNGANTRLRP